MLFSYLQSSFRSGPKSDKHEKQEKKSRPKTLVEEGQEPSESSQQHQARYDVSKMSTAEINKHFEQMLVSLSD